MKTKYIFLFCTLALIFQSCKKCETCTPYRVTNTGLSTTPDNSAQTLTLCDKTDITAYESLTTFQDANEKPVKFICK
jgi:hypothetical protein